MEDAWIFFLMSVLVSVASSVLASVITLRVVTAVQSQKIDTLETEVASLRKRVHDLAGSVIRLATRIDLNK